MNTCLCLNQFIVHMIFNTNQQFINNVLKSFSKCFEMRKPQLIEIAYKTFHANFNGEIPKRKIEIELADLIIKGLPYSELEAEPHHYGIDLPVLLSKPENN